MIDNTQLRIGNAIADIEENITVTVIGIDEVSKCCNGYKTKTKGYIFKFERFLN